MNEGDYYDDPLSSALAVEEIAKSGALDSSREMVLAAVTAKPGRTSGTLAWLFALDRHEVARRLPDLRNVGKVQHCARVCQGACKINGHYCEKAQAIPLRGRRELKWWPRR